MNKGERNFFEQIAEDFGGAKGEKAGRKEELKKIFKEKYPKKPNMKGGEMGAARSSEEMENRKKFWRVSPERAMAAEKAGSLPKGDEVVGGHISVDKKEGTITYHEDREVD